MFSPAFLLDESQYAKFGNAAIVPAPRDVENIPDNRLNQLLNVSPAEPAANHLLPGLAGRQATLPAYMGPAPHGDLFGPQNAGGGVGAQLLRRAAGNAAAAGRISVDHQPVAATKNTVAIAIGPVGRIRDTRGPLGRLRSQDSRRPRRGATRRRNFRRAQVPLRGW